MAGNDILGKPNENRPASEKAELILAARMSKKYDSLELEIDGSVGPISIADIVQGGQFTVVRGSAFVNHPRAHRCTIVADDVIRVRWNGIANDVETVGDISSVADTEDTLELDSVFIETTVGGGTTTKIQIKLT